MRFSIDGLAIFLGIYIAVAKEMRGHTLFSTGAGCSKASTAFGISGDGEDYTKGGCHFDILQS